MTFQHLSDKPRVDLDFYPTPYDAIQAIRPYVNTYHVWEPACGNGRISEELKKSGCKVFSTDIKDYGYPGLNREIDFYDIDKVPYTFAGKEPLTIITNPPYGRDTGKFATHSLNLARARWETFRAFTRVILLYRHTWDTAPGRIDLVRLNDFKINMMWRLRWIEDTSVVPFHNYSWFIWDNGGTGLRRNEYVNEKELKHEHA